LFTFQPKLKTGNVNIRPRLIKGIQVFAGMIALLLAYLGIIIPGLPAIPFIFVAAYLFAKSSPKLYSWLMRRRLLKKLLNRANKVNRSVFKWLMVSQIWFSVAIVEYTLAQSLTAMVLIACAGVLITVFVLVFIKTNQREKHHDSD
jgi:uncharacterized membrane protein YbaN (DUF454 family)